MKSSTYAQEVSNLSANSLSLEVIAEGVETVVQRDFLANAGCHYYQGYFFSRPLPVQDFEALAQLRVCTSAQAAHKL